MPVRVARFLALSLAIALPSGGHAVQDLETSALPGSRMELVVVEVPGCFYCRLFRRDVLPSYEASIHAREVPIRVLDLKRVRDVRLSLSRPISVVPTIVLLRDKKEVGRIDGYVGAHNFLRYVNNLLSRWR